jgi:hypothetical protein
MKWKEHCEKLLVGVTEAQNQFMPIWNELAKSNPIEDVGFLIRDNHNYKQWQHKLNNYNNTVLYLGRNGVNPDDDMPNNFNGAD